MQKKDVIHLIDALSPKEIKEIKRDFKQRLSNSKATSLLHLWKRYERLMKKNHNIDAIDIGVTNKKITAKKRTLKEEILNSLVNRSTNAEAPVEDSFHIKILAILYERNLYDEMRSKLDKYKKGAKEKEQYSHLSKILEWEMQWLKQNSSKKEFATLQSLIEEQEHYLKLNQKVVQCKNIYQQILLILEQDFKLINPTNKNLFKKLYQENVLDEDKLKPHLQRSEISIPFWIYRIKSMYHRTIRNPEKAYEYGKKLIGLFEQNESQYFLKFNISALLCLSKSCINEYKKEIPLIINKLNELAVQSNDLSIKNQIRSALYHIETINAIRTSQFQNIDVKADKMHQNWETIAQSESKGKLLYYSYYYCLLYWLNQSNIVDKTSAQQNEKRYNQWSIIALSINCTYKGRNFYSAIKMLDICNQYDEGAYDRLDSSLDAYQKLLAYNNQLDDFKKTVLKTITNLKKEAFSINKDSSKILNCFKQLESQLSDFLECENFVRPTSFHQVAVWCKGHILNKPYLEIHKNFRKYFPNYR